MYKYKDMGYLEFREDSDEELDYRRSEKQSSVSSRKSSLSTTSRSEDAPAKCNTACGDVEFQQVQKSLQIVNEFLAPKKPNYQEVQPKAVKPDLKFEFSNRQVVSEKKISDIIGGIVSYAVLKENTVFINWMKILDRPKINKYLFLVLCGFNGKDINNLAAHGELPFLTSVMNEWSSVDIENPKLITHETHFWENLFEAPNLKSKTAHLTRDERMLSYLASDSNKMASDYPDERNPRCFGYENTKKWTKPSQLGPSWNTKLQAKPLKSLPKLVVIDCEMIQTVKGLEVVKISCLDQDYNLLLDAYCLPSNPVVNYNTAITGITPWTLRGVRTTLADIHEKMRTFITPETVLLGHSLNHDLHALKLIHHKVVDTALIFSVAGRKQSLKSLVKEYLGVTFQENSHESFQDAIATLALYRLKADILDMHGLCAQTPDFGKITKVVDGRDVLILENPEELGWLRNSAARSVPIATNDIDSIMPVVRSEIDTDCTFARIYSRESLHSSNMALVDEKTAKISPLAELKALDSYLSEIVAELPEKSLIVISTCDPMVSHRRLEVNSRVNEQLSGDPALGKMKPNMLSATWIEPTKSLSNKVIAFIK